jgi:hypothetical protein
LLYSLILPKDNQNPKMQFSTAFVAIAATFFTSASAGMTSAEVVTNINVLTTVSSRLQGPANDISLLSGPQFLLGQGPFPVNPSSIDHILGIPELNFNSKSLLDSPQSLTQFPLTSKQWR